MHYNSSKYKKESIHRKDKTKISSSICAIVVARKVFHSIFYSRITDSTRGNLL